jgi:hypothetical protein
MKSQRLCLECNERLLGRTDKKFCSDYCRNTFNNRQNSEFTKYIRDVNRILRSNRRILMEYRNVGRQEISERRLLQLGFRMNYTTGHKLKPNGKIQMYIYDQVMEHLENDTYLLNGKKESARDM